MFTLARRPRVRRSARFVPTLDPLAERVVPACYEYVESQPPEPEPTIDDLTLELAAEMSRTADRGMSTGTEI